MAAEDDLLVAVSEMRDFKNQIIGFQAEMADLNNRRALVQAEINRLQALYVTKRTAAKAAASQI